MPRTAIIINKHKVTAEEHGHLHYAFEQLFPGAILFPSITPQETSSIIEDIKPDNVFMVGGDGTANSAIEASITHGCTLGTIPFGSGNDYAAMLGFNGNIKKAIHKTDLQALERIMHPYIATHHGNDTFTARTDVGAFSVNDGPTSYFLNSLGVGFFAEINEAVQQEDGEKHYLKAMFAKLRGPNEPTATSITSYENRRTPTTHTVTTSLDILIGQRFGNNNHINPEGIIDDGQAELIAFRNTRIIPTLRNLLHVKLRTGLHLCSKQCIYKTGITKATINYNLQPEEIGKAVQYDGELHPERARKLDVDIYHNKLKVVKRS